MHESERNFHENALQTLSKGSAKNLKSWEVLQCLDKPISPTPTYSPELVKATVARELEPKFTYFKTCLESLKEFRAKKLLTTGSPRGEYLPLDARQWQLLHILRKQGTRIPEQIGANVYNPSVMFKFRGNEYMFGRAEGARKEDELNSFSILFILKHGKWIPMPDHIYKIQDPNVAWVNGQMVLSGVEISNDRDENGNPLYRMVFYMGKDIDHLELAFKGPLGQKGSKVCNSPIKGELGLYTRSQGKKGGAGQIGYTSVESLEILKEKGAQLIEDAPLLNMRFPDGEWGGVNQVIPLKNGSNLLVGHRAYIDKDLKKHYYPWACIHDPFTGKIEDLGILAERSDFDPSSAKAPDLEDVLYTVGVVRKGGEWFLLVGVSDAHSGMIKLEERALFPQGVYHKKAA